MRTRCILVAFVVFVLTGCATLKNTPQQDYMWEIGRICDTRVPFWKMAEVRADGSATVQGRQMRRQAGQTTKPVSAKNRRGSRFSSG